MIWRRTLGQRGLTLVEIMIVMVVLSLLALFVAPEIVDWKPKMRLKSAADEMLANLQLAKVQAVKENADVVVTVNTSCPGGDYTIDFPVSTDLSVDYTANPDEHQGICLNNSTFAAGEGFNSRGLPLVAGGGVITLTHEDLDQSGDPTYTITQTVAGAVQLNKVPVP